MRKQNLYTKDIIGLFYIAECNGLALVTWACLIFLKRSAFVFSCLFWSRVWKPAKSNKKWSNTPIQQTVSATNSWPLKVAVTDDAKLTCCVINNWEQLFYENTGDCRIKGSAPRAGLDAEYNKTYVSTNSWARSSSPPPAGHSCRNKTQ